MNTEQIKRVGITHLKSKLNTLTDLLVDFEEQRFTTIEQAKALINKDAERMRKILKEYS